MNVEASTPAGEDGLHRKWMKRATTRSRHWPGRWGEKRTERNSGRFVGHLIPCFRLGLMIGTEEDGETDEGAEDAGTEAEGGSGKVAAGTGVIHVPAPDEERGGGK